MAGRARLSLKTRATLKEEKSEHHAHTYTPPRNESRLSKPLFFSCFSCTTPACCAEYLSYMRPGFCFEDSNGILIYHDKLSKTTATRDRTPSLPPSLPHRLFPPSHDLFGLDAWIP